jgi:2,3-bisphosphoglycerate-independent phosphoglycerate mutase
MKPIVLIVLDGWGYSESGKDNAIAAAKTPFWDSLWQTYPHTVLHASEEMVGLPAGQMGNSEIGHMTIGSGKTLATDLVRINNAISSGEFAKNPAFIELFNHVKKHDSTLHIQGLVSAGGVHSHHDHLFAFLRAAKEAQVEQVAIHAFTDGRDTPPQSAKDYLRELEDVLDDIGLGNIATVSGRFYAMDRDNNWDRLAKAEEALFECKGKVCVSKKPSDVFEELYKDGVLDEHAEPLVFLDDTGKGYPISQNDGVFFFNFRADRARMLSKKIMERAEKQNLCFVTLTEYDKELGNIVAFGPDTITTTLAEQVSLAGMKQAHIAETEKYPHATYFLNGGREEPHEGEEHIMVPSRKDVPTHDLAPKMRAEGIADKAVEAIQHGTEFIFINFANADMVGHTANVPAIIEAVEEVDIQLKRVVDAAREKGGAVFITADHGNAELNIDPVTSEKHTAHTTNLVPGLLTLQNYTLAEGTLADIAPTILELFSIEKPSEMTGNSLLRPKA